ncbi:hypothetical protein Tco_1286639 [Tanacetum coccineum]
MFLYRVTLSSRLDRNIIAVDAVEISRDKNFNVDHLVQLEVTVSRVYRPVVANFYLAGLLFFFAFDAICGRRDLFAGVVFLLVMLGFVCGILYVVAAVKIVSATLSITSTSGVPIGIAMSMNEDYMMAMEINKVCGEVDNVVQDRFHYLEELYR